MYWVSKGFIFSKVDSIVHKLDPRVKLLISIQFFTLALLVSDLIDLTIISSFSSSSSINAIIINI